MDVVFSKTGHFWIDVGIVGLHSILSKVDTISIEVTQNSLILSGEKEEINDALEYARSVIEKRYYNVSTKKYNIYYDKKEECFKRVPRINPTGIAKLIESKAPAPVGEELKWGVKEDKDGNEKKVLPDKYSNLQEELDEFIKDCECKLPKKFLVDGTYYLSVGKKIELEEKKYKYNCIMCGQACTGGSHYKVSQAVFPLITTTTGIKSFNAGAGTGEIACWKCHFVSKFVPVVGFFTKYFKNRNESMHIFLPYSSSLKKMIKTFNKLSSLRDEHENGACNFDLQKKDFDPEGKLKTFFEHFHETTFVFLYYLFKKLLNQKNAGLNKKNIEEHEEEREHKDLHGLIVEEGQLTFYVLEIIKQNQRFATRALYPFKDSFYFYRLISYIESEDVDIKDVLRLLVNNQRRDSGKTILRDKFCKRVLHKESVVDLVEKHIYTVKKTYIKPLFDFLMIYESIIKGGSKKMTDEEREVAVNVGSNVGMIVGKKQKRESDLFKLRKSRKLSNFLEQISRLQFKYGNCLYVNPEIYKGKLHESNFKEFKSFFMVSALNSFNYAQYKKGS